MKWEAAKAIAEYSENDGIKTRVIARRRKNKNNEFKKKRYAGKRYKKHCIKFSLAHRMLVLHFSTHTNIIIQVLL